MQIGSHSSKPGCWPGLLSHSETYVSESLRGLILLEHPYEDLPIFWPTHILVSLSSTPLQCTVRHPTLATLHHCIHLHCRCPRGTHSNLCNHTTCPHTSRPHKQHRLHHMIIHQIQPLRRSVNLNLTIVVYQHHRPSQQSSMARSGLWKSANNRSAHVCAGSVTRSVEQVGYTQRLCLH